MAWSDKIRRDALRELEKQVTSARDDFIATWKKGLDSGTIEDEPLSPYGRSQKYRRERSMKQTSTKDLQFSGTLANSLLELSRHKGEDYVEITLGFTGQANRRTDQQSSLTNKKLADYLALQQRGGKSILKLPASEIERIQQKWGVTIK